MLQQDAGDLLQQGALAVVHEFSIALRPIPDLLQPIHRDCQALARISAQEIYQED